MKVYMIFVVVLCAVGLLHAKSIRKRAVCSPPEPEDDCYNVCDDILYFYSKDQEKCDNCIFCPKGEEPDHIASCYAQGTGIEVKCAACRSGYYSDSESQDHCFPCQHCLNRVTVTECTATTDRVCGDCKPGFYEDGGYCSSCGDHLNDKQKEAKGCLSPVQSTSKPTTTEETTTPNQHTSKLPSTPKQTPIQETPKLPSTPKQIDVSIANIRRTTIASTPKSDPSNNKEVDDIHVKHQTHRMGIVALSVVIVLVAVVTGAYCIVKTCTQSKGLGSSISSQSSFSSTESTHAGSDAKNANGNLSLSSSTSSVDKTTKQDVEVNFDVIKKKFQEKNLVLQTESVGVQKSPSEEKEKQTKPKSAPPGKPSDMPRFTNYPNAAVNNLNHDKVVMNSENPQLKKKKRSLSVPVIITPNLLESFRNHAKGENSQNRLSDVSSDDSDQGQEEEDTLLKRPSTSSMLTIPSRRSLKGRRNSLATFLPLSPSGGKLSSGSAGKDYALDSMDTTSRNNPSTRLPRIGSLTSHPSNAVKEKKHAKLKKQHSHDNAVMEKLNVDNDEVFEATPLLEENMPPKGPVTQPQEQDDQGEPAFVSYQPVHQQYGEVCPLVSNRDQEHVAKCNRPSNGSFQGYRTLDSRVSAPQDPEPIAKCDITAVQTPRTNNTRTASPLSARRNSASRSMPSPSRQPGGHGPSVELPAGHGPQITYVHYHGPVIHAEGSTSVQFALGNNSNQIQQGASGAGCSNPRQPPTQESSVAVPCSDDGRATFPTNKDSLA